jgi:hypothetical protein
MNKKIQTSKVNTIEVIKTLPQELFDNLAREYKRDQDFKRNLHRLKIIMARTYISTLVH